MPGALTKTLLRLHNRYGNELVMIRPDGDNMKKQLIDYVKDAIVGGLIDNGDAFDLVKVSTEKQGDNRVITFSVSDEKNQLHQYTVTLIDENACGVYRQAERDDRQIHRNNLRMAGD